LADGVLDFDRLEEIGRVQRELFATAKPFPHLVIDDFLEPEAAERVHEEFLRTTSGWHHYHHYNEKKEAVTSLEAMEPHTRELVDALHSRRFVAFVERLTGIESLVPDPELDGAGLHRSFPGGFLNVHTDFLSHTTHRSWSRQVNLLIYLNKNWNPEWRGDLELWDAEVRNCVATVTPIFNRCVLFRTTEASYHGHPHPLACPAGESRKSLALYYFREERQALRLQPTHYRPLPWDSPWKKILVASDRQLLRAYSLLKRYAGLSDRAVGRILKRL
jgi:Rps23 Pro-64 3,4-dihydroxylase Tpa1-like proline 4-hydroxylase